MKKKTRMHRGTAAAITVFLGILILICIGAILWIVSRPAEEPLEPVGPVSTIEEPSSEPEPDPPATVRLIGVGDDLIHEAIYQQAGRRAGGNGYDFEYAYQNIKELIASADIASINQETVMAEEYELSAYPMFNSPTDLGRYLSGIGFDVFNQATNHSLDKGRDKGLLSTLNFWSTVPGAAVVGAYKDEADYAKIRTLEKNGVTFAFLGMTESTNGIQMPENSRVILMRTQDEEKIRVRIEQAKELADVVVVNVHWGVEYTHTPNEMQKSLAKKMVDWGADVILGHHPHVIQPVEYIEREDGTRGVVAYSLGNFISAQDAGPRMIGGALDVEVTKDFSSGKTEITKVQFLPMITHFERGWANIRIYPYEQYSDELAKTHGVRSGKTPEFSMEYIDGILNEVIGEEFLAK